MLRKFGHVRELDAVTLSIPKDAQAALLESVQVLDNEYGEDRNVEDDDGGYAVLLEEEADIAQLKEFFPLDTWSPEWVDLSRSGYTSSLYMLNNEYGVVLVMPLDLARKIPNIKTELEDCSVR